MGVHHLCIIHLDYVYVRCLWNPRAPPIDSYNYACQVSSIRRVDIVKMARFVNSAVVLLLIASLAVCASAVGAPKPSNWQLCDKHANYGITVKNVSINPDPVVSGEEMTFVVPAYTDKEITGGSVVVSVSFHGITVHTEQSNICDKAQCPIAPGTFVLDNTQVLPGITPPGSYKIKLQFLGEEGEQLACANINFSIVWSLAEAVESFNPIKMYKKHVDEEVPVAHK